MMTSEDETSLLPDCSVELGLCNEEDDPPPPWFNVPPPPWLLLGPDCLGGCAGTPAAAAVGSQGWKSQRKKSIDFLHRFINPYPSLRIFCVNHKDLAKVSRLLIPRFFLRFFYINKLVWIFPWIFGWFESVSSMFYFDLCKYSLCFPPPPCNVVLLCCDNVIYRSS